jgi:hypothetical protein
MSTETKISFITYLFYIVFWEFLCIGGCGYIVFVLGNSGLWFILAFVLSVSAYRPESWNKLINSNQKNKTNER